LQAQSFCRSPAVSSSVSSRGRWQEDACTTAKVGACASESTSRNRRGGLEDHLLRQLCDSIGLSWSQWRAASETLAKGTDLAAASAELARKAKTDMMQGHGAASPPKPEKVAVKKNTRKTPYVRGPYKTRRVASNVVLGNTLPREETSGTVAPRSEASDSDVRGKSAACAGAVPSDSALTPGVTPGLDANAQNWHD